MTHLYALAALERDLPWLMGHELLAPAAGRALPEQVRTARLWRARTPRPPLACPAPRPAPPLPNFTHPTPPPSPPQVRQAVHELSPHSQALVDALGVPPHLVAAPIAGDWERYNAVDNRGELVGPQFA